MWHQDSSRRGVAIVSSPSGASSGHAVSSTVVAPRSAAPAAAASVAAVPASWDTATTRPSPGGSSDASNASRADAAGDRRRGARRVLAGPAAREQHRAAGGEQLAQPAGALDLARQPGLRPDHVLHHPRWPFAQLRLAHGAGIHVGCACETRPAPRAGAPDRGAGGRGGRAPAAPPLPRRPGRGALRLRARAARPARSGGRADPDPLRALPAPRPRPARARDARRRRGRPGLLDDRQPRLLPRARRAAARAARPAARRRARHGPVGALDCKALRRTVDDYIRRAGRCAAQLGPRVDRFTTRASVDDLADVLDALRIRRVDMYGDSYGSYFAQAFAVNHPDRLRSLVLDATYPLPGTDPAYGDLAEATWRAYSLVCARRPSCADRGEEPRAALQRFVERIRARPRARDRARTRRASGSGCASTSTRCSRSPSPATAT